jgi:C-8 sterol isomerase
MGYIFKPDALQALAKPYVGAPHEEMVAGIINDLSKAYPGHIDSRQKWILSICGGVMGIMNIMHGSVTEYVLIYGTPIGTEGFSGRFHADIFDIIVSGEMWTYTESDFRRPIVTKPGELAHLRRRDTKGVRLFENTWMLEYGRGAIATTLPFALSGALTSLEPRPIIQTLGVYARLTIKELFQGKI